MNETSTAETKIETKTILKTIKFTAQEQEKLNEILASSRLGFSTLVKTRIFSNESIQAIKDAQKYARQKLAQAKCDTHFDKLLRELHYISNNLNQVTRKLNSNEMLDKFALDIIAQTHEKINEIKLYCFKQPK